MGRAAPRITIATEVYWPDESGTSHLITELARAVSVEREVAIVTATPGPAYDGAVEVHRIAFPMRRGESALRRIIGVSRRSFAIAREACRTLMAGDVIFTVVGPTLLPYFIGAWRPRGSHFALIVHDVYPDAAVAGGLLGKWNPLTLLWRMATRWSLRSADVTIAIGHDMGRLLTSIEPKIAGRLLVIPHWVDLDRVSPQPRESSRIRRELQIDSRLVVQVAGNLGLTHGIDDLLAAEKMLRRRYTRSDLTILAIGGGAREAAILAASQEPGSLFVFAGKRPRKDESDFLAAADICFVGYAAGMTGVSVPSRVPVILSAGCAVLAVAERDADLAQLIAEWNVGWLTLPGHPNEIVAAIDAAMSDPEVVHEMGQSARRAAQSMDSVSVAAERYVAAVTRAWRR